MRNDRNSGRNRRSAGSRRRSSKPYNDDYLDDDYEDDLYEDDDYEDDLSEDVPGEPAEEEDAFEDIDLSRKIHQNYEHEENTFVSPVSEVQEDPEPRQKEAGRTGGESCRDEERSVNRHRYEEEKQNSRHYEEEPRNHGRYEDELRDHSRYEDEPRNHGRYEDEPRDRRRYEEEEASQRSRRSEGRGYGEHRRHKGDRPIRKKKRGGGCCLGGCLVPLLLLILMIGGVGYLTIGLFAGRMQDAGFAKSSVSVNQDLAASTEEAMDGYRNIMLFGVDSRDQDPLAQGALADSCMLLSINKKNGDIQLLSIYRDTYVETTDGSHKKLTEVYAAYGPKEMLQTINRNFDLDVKEYVTYTWAAVADYINGIGGMDLTITSAEAAGINDYIDEVIKNTGIESSYVSEDISSEGQLCHLDGVQTVTYCRLRKGLGDDYKRTERQRTVVSKAVSMAKKNPVSAVSSAYQVMPEIASNLSNSDLLSLLVGFPMYDLVSTAAFPYTTGDATLNGGAYLYAYTLTSNNAELHANMFGNTNYEPSGTVWELQNKQGDVFGY